VESPFKRPSPGKRINQVGDLLPAGFGMLNSINFAGADNVTHVTCKDI
jgi:hypothetical protein